MDVNFPNVICSDTFLNCLYNAASTESLGRNLLDISRANKLPRVTMPKIFLQTQKKRVGNISFWSTPLEFPIKLTHHHQPQAFDRILFSS